MKTTSIMLACTVVAGAVLFSGCPCPGTRVILPDRALESAVRAALNSPFGCISEADLARIVEIQAGSLGIQRLDGLELCSSLTVANLSNNSIDSITAVSFLGNLTYLDISENDITNIEPLAGLFFLQTLILDGNPRILDWTALEANVANGGFPEGGTVVVGEESVLAEDGTTLPSFERAQAALLAAGVDVIITTASAQ